MQYNKIVIMAEIFKPLWEARDVIVIVFVLVIQVGFVGSIVWVNVKPLGPLSRLQSGITDAFFFLTATLTLLGVLYVGISSLI